MITASQKAKLCEMAQQLKPIFEIGKNGIGEKEIIDISMPTDNNTNVAKTPIFQRFYEKCSLAVHTVQLRSPFPKII